MPRPITIRTDGDVVQRTNGRPEEFHAQSQRPESQRGTAMKHSVRWLNGSWKLAFEFEFQGEFAVKLEINEVSQSDRGTYKLLAKNQKGEAVSQTVVVRDIPEEEDQEETEEEQQSQKEKVEKKKQEKVEEKKQEKVEEKKKEKVEEKVKKVKSKEEEVKPKEEEAKPKAKPKEEPAEPAKPKEEAAKLKTKPKEVPAEPAKPKVEPAKPSGEKPTVAKPLVKTVTITLDI